MLGAKVKIFIGGNMKILTKYFKNILNKNPRCVLIGEHLFKDARATYEFSQNLKGKNSWDVILIKQNLSEKQIKAWGSDEDYFQSQLNQISRCSLISI